MIPREERSSPRLSAALACDHPSDREGTVDARPTAAEKRCTASPFGQGQGHGLGHEKTARPQADGRLQVKTSLSPAQENLHPAGDSQPIHLTDRRAAPNLASNVPGPCCLKISPIEKLIGPP